MENQKIPSLGSQRTQDRLESTILDGFPDKDPALQMDTSYTPNSLLYRRWNPETLEAPRGCRVHPLIPELGEGDRVNTQKKIMAMHGGP